MPVGEAFRLPFIEIKPFWREGRPLPYKIQHPDKSKFEFPTTYIINIRKGHFMKIRNFFAFCSVLFMTIMVIGLLPVHGEERIYDEVIRLHVLANSDTEEDQALKLKVRDGILAAAGEMLSGCEVREDALYIISNEEGIERLESAAAEVIAREGFSYPVKVTVSEEEYPRRNYDSLAFPAGTYTSLRVQIGDADGQNWWCVLFPRLCLGAATADNRDAFIEVGFTPEQYKIVTDTDEPEYEVRFKILEIIEGLME